MAKSTKTKSNKFLKKILIALVIVFYWIWLFYTTQPATDNNTYKQDIIINDIEINYAFHRGNDSINIMTDDNSYLLFVNWRNEQKTNAFVEELISENNEISIIVWKHAPTTIRSLVKNDFSVLQIVDLRTNDNIYFDVADFNNNQSIERIFGVIGGAFCTMVILIFNKLEFVFKLLGKIKLKNKK